MTMKDRKQTALNEVLTAYETYQGKKRSKLEECIQALQKDGKMSLEDFNSLISAIADDRQYIFGILANSWRVRISFDNKPVATHEQNSAKNYPFADLDKLYEPLGELDE